MPVQAIKIEGLCQECGKVKEAADKVLCDACFNARWPHGVGSENAPQNTGKRPESFTPVASSIEERTAAFAPSLPPGVNESRAGFGEQQLTQAQPQDQARGAGRSWEKLVAEAIKAPSGSIIVEECLAVATMLVAKNRKYGNSALNPKRIFSKASAIEQIKVRIDDKLSRIESGQLDEDEDVISDLIGYLVLLRIAMWHT